MKLFKFKKILLKEYVSHLQDKLIHTNQVINESNKTIAHTSMLIDNYIIETKAIEEKQLLEEALVDIHSSEPKKQKV